MIDTAITDLWSAVTEVGGLRLDLADGRELAQTITWLREAIDALEGVEAEAFKDEGASSTTSWARQHLRLTPKSARSRVRAGRTLRQLPEVAAASRAGEIRLEHVKQFTVGVTKVGAEAMVEAQPYLLPVAKTCDPSVLLGTINKLIDAVDPDRLDRAYADGMEKTDLKLAKCADGYHVTGFLDIATGTAFKTMLEAAAAPKGADDARAPSQRRVEAIREMVSAILEHGLPRDGGVRPQLHVIADWDTLSGDSLAEPATLTGFGPIGRDLLDYLRCNADLTPFLVDGLTDGPTPQADVLNVGRSWRLATTKQREAVRLRQGGECANPGCSNTHLELHHVRWWLRDRGRTDLDNLVGLCPACHHLVHAHKLFVQADGHRGFVFGKANGRRAEDHRRTQRERVRRHLRRLRKHPGDRSASPGDEADPEGAGSASDHDGPVITVRGQSPPPPDRHNRQRRGRRDHAWPAPSVGEYAFAHAVHRPRPPMRT